MPGLDCKLKVPLAKAIRGVSWWPPNAGKGLQ